MHTDSRRILRTFHPSRILLPIVLGLGAASYLLFRSFAKHAFQTIQWSWDSSFWIFMALIAVVIRDLSYMVRIRALVDNEIDWWQSFVVIMLWEFCSAV